MTATVIQFHEAYLRKQKMLAAIERIQGMSAELATQQAQLVFTSLEPIPMRPEEAFRLYEKLFGGET